MRFLLSGALNFDIFYEVPSLGELDLPGLGVVPGGEVALSPGDFEALREKLSRVGKEVARCGGGSAANTAFALARFGFEVAFCGACGEDEAGEEVQAELSAAGVELSGVLRAGSTGRALIVLDGRRDRFIAVSPGTCERALAAFDPEPSGDLLHLSSLVSGEGFAFHQRLVQRFCGRVSLDPGEIYAARGRDLRGLLEGVSLLFITEAELEKLRFSPEELFALGVQEIYLKRGARGAARLGPVGKIELAAERAAEVVDNTGAGDFFDAGVLAGLALGFSPEAALRLGLKVAAASLRDYGRRGCPSRKEFLNWVRELEEDGLEASRRSRKDLGPPF